MQSFTIRGDPSSSSDTKIKLKYLNLLENCPNLFEDLGIYYLKLALKLKQNNYVTTALKSNSELIVPCIIDFNDSLDVSLVTQLSQIDSNLFKKQLNEIPELKRIVTNVLQSSKNEVNSGAGKNAKMSGRAGAIGLEQPKIKLKMNFTNFK